jgi:hypothetical protein
MAKFSLKLTEKGYQVYEFREDHNHPLQSAGEMHYLRSNRHLTPRHKQFIIDCSKVNLGATKAFKLYSQIVGGPTNVGACAIDFKNFQRDLKVYIGDSDAQITIDQFHTKEDYCSDFFFEYKVDGSDRLTHLFWADSMSRKNYELFGDTVSFDSTYQSNR